MADTKTTGLTENTTPALTDIMYYVDDPGGSALSQKIKVQTLRDYFKSTGGRELISSQSPTGTGTVTWSSIPATYNSLEIEYIADTDASSVTSTSIRMYFNNDTTATNYRSSLHFAYGTNSAVTVGADTASIVNVTGASSPANHCGRGWIKIIGYAGTTYYKESQSLFSYREDATTNHEVSGRGGHCRENTEAVNRVDLVTVTGNYLAGTVFRLYGVY